MSKDQKFVIVGGGLAGASAAETLRTEGFDGHIRLIGAEPYRPYIRPPLSKDYLSGKDELETVFVHPEAWYAENSVELTVGTAATTVDAAAHEVTLANGEKVGYDKLLLATGSKPRVLSIPGSDLAGVHYLRTIDDSKALHDALAGGDKKLVLIGSGWIGMEVAATARTLGNDVTILERDAVPLANAIGDELGRLFGDMHDQNGVVRRMSVNVDSIVGVDGAATGVVIDDNETIPADLILVGVGVIPNTDLAEAAGLRLGNGILVDESMRTSDPDIFAAGDVASAWHPFYGEAIRVEHWANALNQPKVAAASMRGVTDLEYDRLPYFFSDQYDMGMEYVGHIPGSGYEQVVFRGDPDSGEYMAFWLAAGRVLAGMNVNVWDVVDDVRSLILSRAVVDVARLQDPAVALKDVATA
jgi:3-phenylpropionate/trans-cinnamate dioxygenase ferredoxin reductase component